jgi:hypothetical protein
MVSHWQAVWLREELCASKSVPPILRNDNFRIDCVISRNDRIARLLHGGQVERFRSRNPAQSEKADDPPGDEDGSAINRSELTIDELVKMKALNHERMDAVRENWRLEASEMPSEEREQAAERFRLAADKIASQFGRSRRFVNKDEVS